MTDDDRQESAPTEVYRRPAAPPGWYEDDERDEVSLVRAVNVLLRHRWKVLGVPIFLIVGLVGYTLLQPPKYSTTTSFLPQSASGGGAQLSQISGVAAQFGIDVPMGQAGQSPQFYADLLLSRRLLEEAVTWKYRPMQTRNAGAVSPTGADNLANSAGSLSAATKSDSVSSTAVEGGRTLVELYRIDAPTGGRAINKATRRLENALSVSANTETGLVTLSVTTPWPAVSRQVADRLIALVNQFNNRVRQSQAAEQAAFIKGRLQDAREELRRAEDSLESFLQANVGWQQSPALRFQHDRLQRRVNLKQQVYTSLATRYEEARISEVKSTPVVTTVTRPRVPVEPESRRVLLKVLLGLVAGGLLGGLWAFGAEFAEGVRDEKTEDYREFVSLRQDAAEDLRRAGRRIRRLLGREEQDSGG